MDPHEDLNFGSTMFMTRPVYKVIEEYEASVQEVSESAICELSSSRDFSLAVRRRTIHLSKIKTGTII
jgi:hypothetical protein